MALRDLIIADGAAAYWELQELSGTTANDSISTNDGTYTGSVLLGRNGLYPDSPYAVEFNGTNTYVDCGDILDPLTNFTYEAVFQCDVLPGAGQLVAILYKWQETAASDQIALGIDANGLINFAFHTTGGDSYGTAAYNNIVGTGFPITVGARHHVVVTRSVTTINIWLDGVRIYTGTPIDVNQLKDTTSPYRIGAEAAVSGRYFTGLISDVAIYSSALTETVIKAHYTSTFNAQKSYRAVVVADNPDAYYGLGEPAGVFEWDLIGTKNGAFQNGPVLGASGLIVNDSDKAIDFDGIADHITFGTIFNFDRTDKFSLECWFQTTASNASNRSLISKQSSSGSQTGYNLSIAGYIEFDMKNVSASNDLVVRTYENFNDGAIHHVVVTNDGSSKASGVKIYVDGILRDNFVIRDSLTASISSGNITDFQIGARDSSTFLFDGVIDEVAVYSKTLSQAQVEEHHAAGRAIYTNTYPYQVLASGPVQYWRMAETSGTAANSIVNNATAGTYNDATGLGDVSYLKGDHVSRGWRFDGSTGRVNLASLDGFTPNADFTIEFWAKATTQILQPFLIVWNSASSYWAITSRTDGNGICFEGANGAGKFLANSTTQLLVADGWAHIVIKRTGNTWASWKNGVQLATEVDTETGFPTTGSIHFGYNGTSAYMDAAMSDFTLYQHALSDTQIVNHYEKGLVDIASYRAMVTAASPYMHYRMNDTLWEGYARESIRGNHSTSVITNIFEVAGFSPEDYSRDFDGTNDYVDTTAVYTFGGKTAGSIEAVFRADSIATQGRAIYAEYNNGGTFTKIKLGVNTDGSVDCGLRDTASGTFYGVNSGAGKIAVNREYHVVYTFDTVADEQKIYINGALIATDNTAIGTVHSDSPARCEIGGNYDTGLNKFDGRIAEVALYEEVLTAEEVGKHAGARRGHFYGDYAYEVYRSNPNAYFRLDDLYDAAEDFVTNVAATHNDETGFEQPALIANSTDKCRDFDGTNDYIDMVSHPVHLEGSAKATIEAWIELDAIPGANQYAAIYTEINSGGTFTKVAMYINPAGQVQLGWRDTSTGTFYSFTSATVLSTGVKYHVVGAIDTANDSHYIAINGLVDAVNTTATGSIFAGAPVAAGVSIVIASFVRLNGRVDELAIYKKAITQTEVARHYHLGIADMYPVAVLNDIPDAYWRLDETSGTTAQNHVNSANDGTYVSTPTLNQTSLLPSGTGKSITWPSGSYMNAGTILPYERNVPFSIELWVKRTGDGVYLVSRGLPSGNFNGYQVYIEAGGNISFSLISTVGSRLYVTSTTALTAGQTYHFVATYDGSSKAYGVDLYLDGNPESFTISTDTLTTDITSSSQFNLHAKGDVAGTSVVQLDEVSLYPIKLTADQVAFHYQAAAAAAAQTYSIVGAGQISLTGNATMNYSSGSTYAITGNGQISLVGNAAMTHTESAAIVGNGQISVTGNSIMAYASQYTIIGNGALSLTGNAVMSHYILATISEGLGLNEGVSSAQSANIIDSIGMSDSAYRYLYKLVAEGLGLNDVLTYEYRIIGSVSDVLGLSDVDSTNIRGTIAISDSLGMNDVLSTNATLQVLITESFALGIGFEVNGEYYIGWVLNTENLAVSNYTNMKFSSMAAYGGKYYGVQSDGVYELTGDTDGATAIDAFIRTGMIDFGDTHLKRMTDTYIGYRADGTLYLKTTTEEQTERWYKLVTTNDHFTEDRFKLARGVKSRYWQFEIANDQGADFDIDSIELLPVVLTRRIKRK